MEIRETNNPHSILPDATIGDLLRRLALTYLQDPRGEMEPVETVVRGGSVHDSIVRIAARKRTGGRLQRLAITGTGYELALLFRFALLHQRLEAPREPRERFDWRNDEARRLARFLHDKPGSVTKRALVGTLVPNADETADEMIRRSSLTNDLLAFSTEELVTAAQIHADLKIQIDRLVVGKKANESEVRALFNGGLSRMELKALLKRAKGENDFFNIVAREAA